MAPSLYRRPSWPAVTRLFADKIDASYERFHPPRSHLEVGQVLWLAVAVDDPPHEDKRIEDTRLVPIILDLVTPQDIDNSSHGGRRVQIRRLVREYLDRIEEFQSAPIGIRKSWPAVLTILRRRSNMAGG
jgi:hypothetical protein